ncbi:MAG: Crp/Fnr family transcriptional regulator [Bacteroidia bacterium]|nr:Crp/Fnr family transcriptional regulator [Bacteroidia bacterium]
MECIQEIISCAQIHFFAKEEMIVQEGQSPEKIFYIQQGSARAFYLKDGRDITDWFAFEKEFIVPISNFFLDQPSLHYIQSQEESLILSLSKADVKRLAENYREFDRLEKEVITRTMLSLQRRIVSMQFENARQKYENLLAERPDITQRIPLTHIASYLGITLETLSRIRKPGK